MSKENYTRLVVESAIQMVTATNWEDFQKYATEVSKYSTFKKGAYEAVIVAFVHCKIPICFFHDAYFAYGSCVWQHMAIAPAQGLVHFKQYRAQIQIHEVTTHGSKEAGLNLDV